MNDNDTITYLSGTSGRVVCLRENGCAGVTLRTAVTNHPDSRAWRGLNGERFEVLSNTDREVIVEITGGAVCDCSYLSDDDVDECQGHETTRGAIGSVFFCDGSCS